MSLRKDTYTWVWVGVFSCAVVLTALYCVLFLSRPHVSLRIGDGVFNASVARDSQAREKGLSGTKQLGATDALLFAFKDDGLYGVWMKDMHYPIDIVWLNQAKRVVHIEKAIQPESYPKTYIPKTKARYVIEFAAGTIDRKAITLGTPAYFETSHIGEVK